MKKKLLFLKFFSSVMVFIHFGIHAPAYSLDNLVEEILRSNGTDSVGKKKDVSEAENEIAAFAMKLLRHAVKEATVVDYYRSKDVSIPLIAGQSVVVNWGSVGSGAGHPFIPIPDLLVEVTPTHGQDLPSDSIVFDFGKALLSNGLKKYGEQFLSYKFSPFVVFGTKIFLLLKSTYSNDDCSYLLQDLLILMFRLGLTDEVNVFDKTRTFTSYLPEAILDLMDEKNPEIKKIVDKFWHAIINDKDDHSFFSDDFWKKDSDDLDYFSLLAFVLAGTFKSYVVVHKSEHNQQPGDSDNVWFNELMSSDKVAEFLTTVKGKESTQRIKITVENLSKEKNGPDCFGREKLAQQIEDIKKEIRIRNDFLEGQRLLKNSAAELKKMINMVRGEVESLKLELLEKRETFGSVEKTPESTLDVTRNMDSIENIRLIIERRKIIKEALKHEAELIKKDLFDEAASIGIMSDSMLKKKAEIQHSSYKGLAMAYVDRLIFFEKDIAQENKLVEEYLIYDEIIKEDQLPLPLSEKERFKELGVIVKQVLSNDRNIFGGNKFLRKIVSDIRDDQKYSVVKDHLSRSFKALEKAKDKSSLVTKFLIERYGEPLFRNMFPFVGVPQEVLN
jgi:hypothetical protein